MQFPTILVIAALATGVISSPTPSMRVQRRNMHSQATCSTGFNKETGRPIFDDDITAKACEAYRQDVTGSEDGEQCNDCTVIHNIVPGTSVVCGSPDESIGGKEWEGFCKQFGGVRGHANND